MTDRERGSTRDTIIVPHWLLLLLLLCCCLDYRGCGALPYLGMHLVVCLACWTHHTLHMHLRMSSSLFLLCTEANKVEIVRQGAVGPLLGVARSHDPRVQRNATGALLNLTHIGKSPPLSLSPTISSSLYPAALLARKPHYQTEPVLC